MTLPVNWSDAALVDKLTEDGYVISARPIYDVTRLPTPEMDANRAKTETYVRSIYDTLGTFIDRVNVESESNPATLLNEFMAAIAGITVP
jgi:hypothetical protein